VCADLSFAVILFRARNHLPPLRVKTRPYDDIRPISTSKIRRKIATLHA
jgi:hypothetical protein